MKKIITSFILSLVFAGSLTAQQTPNAQQVIDNYITALGGKQKLDAVKTLSMKNKISIMGMEGEGSIKKKDNKFRSTQSVMGQEMVQVFDGQAGYASQMGQKMDLPADKIDKLKNSRPIEALGMEAAKIKNVAKENLEGKDYYVLTSDEGKSYFDVTTGLLYKTTTEQGGMTIKKYTEVDGIKFPEEMVLNMQGMDVEVKNFDIQINTGVADDDFKL